MPTDVETREIEDSVAKVNGEVAVGSDLDFQRKWWRFERVLWTVLTLIVILDALGFFGRGWFAKAHAASGDGTMRVDYDRIERFGAPSLVTVHFSKNAFRNGSVQVWASDTLLHDLGNQRVIPQADRTTLDGPGLLYTYSSTPQPNSVQFQLQPAKPGISWLTFRVPGADEVRLRIIVFP